MEEAAYRHLSQQTYLEKQALFREKKMKKLALVILIMAFGFVMPKGAEAISYTVELYGIEFDQSTTDAQADDKDWYQWIYKLTVVEGDQTRNGLSHYTLEFLIECYNEAFLTEVAGTAGANGVPTNEANLAGVQANEFRLYELPPEVGLDPTTSVYGLKWNMDDDSPEDNEFKDIGDIEYFWFSVPTNIQIAGQAAIKAGPNEFLFNVNIPECPECEEDPCANGACPSTPEPTTMLLFGTGLVGAVLRKKKLLS